MGQAKNADGIDERKGAYFIIDLANKRNDEQVSSSSPGIWQATKTAAIVYTA